MKIVKPMSWKGIDQRHLDESGLIGEFGERIVREYLENMGYKLSRLEKRASGLPDFRIESSRIFVEVKSHKTKKPPIWQKPFFSMLVKIGWKIYVAQPRLKIDKKNSIVVCSDIDWYLFLDTGELYRITYSPL